jgi:type II secretory pathway pseudopilin PulG
MVRMTYSSVLARCRARLQDERGFSLLETVVAIGVIFASLLILAYTATVGFGYESIARQRQSATGIANQTMEGARGLPYARIQTGMLTSDLAGDANIVTGCSGDVAGVYRFMSCTPGSVPGSGEKIVHSSAAANPTTPLVPHSSTLTQNNIEYTIRTYVTNDCTTIDGNICTAIDPYRVTVLVTWTGGRTAPNKLVRIQSLFYSPAGCRNIETHPFAAPCQPYFFGTATVPKGEISVTGAVKGTPFQSGILYATNAVSSVQHEQLSQAEGGYAPTGLELTETTGTRSAGGATEVTTAADSDPGSTSTSVYSTSSLAPTPSWYLRSPISGDDSEVTFSSAGGDTARSDSTTSAGVVNVCPPPTDPGETDAQPCSGARVQQGGRLSASARFDYAEELGSAVLAQIEPSGSPNKTFVNHTLYPATGLCSPTNTADGCIEQTASRSFGTINIGGLPSQISPPANWTSGSSTWSRYLVSIVGYQDRVSAPVGRQVDSSLASGTQVPAPAASVTAGTVYYWTWDPITGAGSYASLPATSDALPAALEASSVSLTQTIDSHTVAIDVSVEVGSATKATTGVSTTVAGAGNLSRTEARAQSTPPRFTVLYRIQVDGSEVVNLRIAVDLKTMEARGVYGPAPLAGT